MSRLTPLQLETLASLKRHVDGRAITLIGGSALALHYPVAFQRATNDLDLVMAVAVDEFEKVLSGIPGWKPGRHEHEWRSAEGVLVDVVPAGPSHLADKFVVWPRSGFRMSLVGLGHALTMAVEVGGVRVARPHVIALLKMVSYLDRPAQRDRDLEDLDFLLKEYVEIGSDAMFDHAAYGLIEDVSTAPALLLGADLGAALSDDERALVVRWLELAQDPDERYRTHVRMIGRHAIDGERRSAELDARLSAFRKGLG